MRFSIIIPIYNVEKYIEECINSVIYQDFIHDEFEIILIDDGSTDNSSIIAKKLASAHSSIKYFKQPNGGLSSARNLGILKSLGEYLIFLDSDDFWVGKKHLSHLSQIIDKTKAEIIFYGFTSYFENEKKKQTPFPFYTPEKISGIFNNDFDYLVNCHIFKPTACDKVILRKTVIENKLFFPEGYLHEDVSWCFDVADVLKTYAIYPSCFYFYREKRLGSLTFEIQEKNVSDMITIITEKFGKVDTIENRINNLNKGLLSYLARNYVTVLHHLTKSDKKFLSTHLENVVKLKKLLHFYPFGSSKRNSRILVYTCRIMGVRLSINFLYQIRTFMKF